MWSRRIAVTSLSRPKAEWRGEQRVRPSNVIPGLPSNKRERACGCVSTRAPIFVKAWHRCLRKPTVLSHDPGQGPGGRAAPPLSRWGPAAPECGPSCRGPQKPCPRPRFHRFRCFSDFSQRRSVSWPGPPCRGHRYFLPLRSTVMEGRPPVTSGGLVHPVSGHDRPCCFRLPEKLPDTRLLGGASPAATSGPVSVPRRD